MATVALAPPTCGLNSVQLRFYQEHGYLIVRHVFTAAEIAGLTAEADALAGRVDLIDSKNIRCRWQNHVDTGACLFECLDPVIDLGPCCRRVARDFRLLEILAAIYGEPAHLFKDKLIYKPPGAVGYDLHQDYIAWPTFPRIFITAAVAIDASGLENGCTLVYPGVHKRGLVTPADGDYHVVPDSVVANVPAVPLSLEPGDVAFFGCFTPHRSGPNRTHRSRRLLYLSYNADSDGGDQREQHYQEFHVWLKGKYAQYGKHETYFR